MDPNDAELERVRKMASDDPENELGHFRLGKLLAESGRHAEAVPSFRKAIELNPDYSKVYELLAKSLIQLGDKAAAIAILREGFAKAEQHGHNMPRDEMSRLLVTLGEAAPASASPGASKASSTPAEGGFRCQRPGCPSGSRAQPLPKPPINDDLGREIQAKICANCWQDWFRNFSIKVINELHLDLSTEKGQEQYDRYMREFFGLS